MNDKKETRIDDDRILIKYKTAGVKDTIIAMKLGITVEEVETRWNRILKIAQEVQKSGYGDLRAQYTILCQQYELLGESLKIISGALSNTVASVELEDMLVGEKQEMVDKLLSSCIILRPFIPPNPIETLENQNNSLN